MPYGFCIYAYFFSDFLHFDMSLLLLTVTLSGVSNKHCLLSLFSFMNKKDSCSLPSTDSKRAVVICIYLFVVFFHFNNDIRAKVSQLANEICMRAILCMCAWYMTA